MNPLRRAVSLLGNLILPPACALCDRTPIPDNSDWCPHCTTRILAAVSVDYCRRCGHTAEPFLVDEEGCRHCRGRRRPISGIARVGPYEGPIGEMIRRYKYNHRQWLDRLLGSMLADTIRSRPWCETLDGLVPVPASFAERWRYRFYPVGALAHETSRRLSLPTLPLLEVRGKKQRQVDLAPSDRVANVRGRFHLARGACVTGARLCLIDDVTTSGATLAECARVLKRAGATEIYAAVLAKAGRDTPGSPT